MKRYLRGMLAPAMMTVINGPPAGKEDATAIRALQATVITALTLMNAINLVNTNLSLSMIVLHCPAPTLLVLTIAPNVIIGYSIPGAVFLGSIPGAVVLQSAFVQKMVELPATTLKGLSVSKWKPLSHADAEKVLLVMVLLV